MSKWFDVSDRDKQIAYEQVAQKVNLPDYAVEKDWWVVQTLAILFETEVGPHMVFKGGTSLSKAWGLIDRFSEDIDLAVDRNFYGFEGDLGKKQRTNLRKKANTYITESLYTELGSRFKAKGLDVKLGLEEITTSDQDPIIIYVNYPNLIESPGYLKPRIQIELGCRSLIVPFTVRKISSMLDENYPEAPFAELPINVPTVDPERTLLEKIFLLHEEFLRSDEKIRVDRMSRHLYDIYKLAASPFGEKALINRELYTEIVFHRHLFTKLGGVDYKLHNPRTVNPIPPDLLLDLWKSDYLTMQEQMIYADSPRFEEMMETIRSYISKLNQLDWEILK
jgi:hypothetical protein